MSIHYCPRCGEESFEKLRTHSHCLQCNFSPDLDDPYEKEPVMNWVVKAVPRISIMETDKPLSAA